MLSVECWPNVWPVICLVYNPFVNGVKEQCCCSCCGWSWWYGVYMFSKELGAGAGTGVPYPSLVLPDRNSSVCRQSCYKQYVNRVALSALRIGHVCNALRCIWGVAISGRKDRGS